MIPNCLDICPLDPNNPDEDNDNICDLIDLCIGVFDECGTCNGSGIPDGICDCNGNINDCFGVCGGDAILDDCSICNGNNESKDDCGVCDGNNFSCTALLFLGEFNLDNKTLTIMYDTPSEIGGFEFNIIGLSIINISGGISEGFTIQNEGSKILGFSLQGDVIPIGSNSLFIIEFEDIISQFTFIENNAIISYPNGLGQFIVNVSGEIDHGQADCLGVYYGSAYLDCDGVCNGPNSHDWDEDGICDNEDPCVGEYNDQGECLGSENPIFFSLSQNYPNPFNPFTSVDFSIPSSDYLTMFVYNLQGQLVKKIINNEFYLAGFYTKTIDASELNSGLYFIQLKNTNYLRTVKITVIK